MGPVQQSIENEGNAVRTGFSRISLGYRIGPLILCSKNLALVSSKEIETRLLRASGDDVIT